MAGLTVKKGDTVKVIAGKDKGTDGEMILECGLNGTPIVEKVNMIKKAQRPTQANPSGGITTVEGPIHVSNVMVVDADGTPTRVGIRTDENGKFVRVSRKTGKDL